MGCGQIQWIPCRVAFPLCSRLGEHAELIFISTRSFYFSFLSINSSLTHPLPPPPWGLTILGVRSHKTLSLFYHGAGREKRGQKKKHQRWTIWASPCFHEKSQTWTGETISDGGWRQSKPDVTGFVALAPGCGRLPPDAP